MSDNSYSKNKYYKYNNQPNKKQKISRNNELYIYNNNKTLKQIAYPPLSSNIKGNNNSTLCIDDNNTIWAFGTNSNGMLGTNINKIIKPKQITELTNIKMISCGHSHTVCCDYTGLIYTLGDNSFGQLGIGKEKSSLSYSCQPLLVDINPVNKISCGRNFTICLLYSGDVLSFGNGSYGQLGLGSEYLSLLPQKINILCNIEFIICGLEYVYCINKDGDIYSWGNGIEGQLGQKNEESLSIPTLNKYCPKNIVSIACGNYHTLMLSSTGQVYSCGSNIYGQLGIPTDIPRIFNIPSLIYDLPLIQHIDCGNEHSMCIDINNNLWVFGFNLFGQLGLGDTLLRDKPTLNKFISNISHISSGGHHTFVKTIDNKIYAFGNNMNGQIDNSSNISQSIPKSIFKENISIWTTKLPKSNQKSARK